MTELRGITDLLKDERLNNIFIEFDKLSIQKNQYGYNLFTLSSYKSFHENFHSDIWASLLNPDGLHNEGPKFLNKFFEYLKERIEINLQSVDFLDASIQRESGRLDILISDNKKAIIIENKINNAPDTDNQISRYFNWCKKNELEVVAILYITLNGLRIAPKFYSELDQIIYNVAVSSVKNIDLVNGWLRPCLSICNTTDTQSFLFQYIKLLTYLAFENIEKDTLDKFYEIANEPGFLDKVNYLKQLKDKIPGYRADKYQKTMEVDYKPFKKICRYKSNMVLFENYKVGLNNFKIDVEFLENGYSSISFWNPGQRSTSGNEDLKKKIEKTSFLDKFIATEDDSWFCKTFTVGESQSMDQIDNEMITFTKNFMIELEKTKNH